MTASSPLPGLRRRLARAVMPAVLAIAAACVPTPQAHSPAAASRPEALLEARLASLPPQRPGIVDLYFVGFAGDSSIDVFMREVLAVQALFDQRFDTAGRSVALINNPATTATVPPATAGTLARALDHVGRLIDPAEDVVFLFLTSHGSHDHALAVNLAGRTLGDLTDEQLAAIVAGSGIGWRVIAVSACFSGGFLDDLAAPEALVMAAARPDRSSFGCSQQRAFTYFGEAYFDEQLRRTRDFEAAFHAAAETIARREAAEGFTPSEPQIAVGSRIQAKLAELERRLSG